MIKIFNTYIFVFKIQRVPHRRHDFGDFAEAGVRMLPFNHRLCVSEEKGVRRYRPENQSSAYKL